MIGEQRQRGHDGDRDSQPILDGAEQLDTAGDPVHRAFWGAARHHQRAARTEQAVDVGVELLGDEQDAQRVRLGDRLDELKPADPPVGGLRVVPCESVAHGRQEPAASTSIVFATAALDHHPSANPAEGRLPLQIGTWQATLALLGQQAMGESVSPGRAESGRLKSRRAAKILSRVTAALMTTHPGSVSARVARAGRR